jgi:hypothetical protein
VLEFDIRPGDSLECAAKLSGVSAELVRAEPGQVTSFFRRHQIGGLVLSALWQRLPENFRSKAVSASPRNLLK